MLNFPLPGAVDHCSSRTYLYYLIILQHFGGKDFVKYAGSLAREI